MTGTPSRTATAVSRGIVERKLKAKLWPEEYESHRRHPDDGRGGIGTRNPKSPGSKDVDAAGIWSEGHVSYPGRSACLPNNLLGKLFYITGVGKPDTTPGLWMDALGIHGSEKRVARTEGTSSGRWLTEPQGEGTGKQKSAESIVVASAPRRRDKHKEPNRLGAFDA